MTELRYKDGIPIFDGSAEQYVAYRRAALNYVETLEWKKRPLAGPRLQAVLEGAAKAAVQHKPPGWISHDRGAQELLDYLKGQGYRLGCVTNKAAQFTLPLLKDLGVHDDFEIIVAGDTLPKKKPDPAPLLHAAENLGVDPSAALMVGDSQSDVKAARAASFQIVCMSYGYNHGEDIRNYNPDAVIDSLTEIQGILENAA